MDHAWALLDFQILWIGSTQPPLSFFFFFRVGGPRTGPKPSHLDKPHLASRPSRPGSKGIRRDGVLDGVPPYGPRSPRLRTSRSVAPLAGASEREASLHTATGRVRPDWDPTGTGWRGGAGCSGGGGML